MKIQDKNIEPNLTITTQVEDGEKYSLIISHDDVIASLIRDLVTLTSEALEEDK